ncbi:hypothetical protein [Streptomyces sp. NPDC048636]|uniref:hypothetical protein n=1 Tax=Streptomyces sp. NPDC048636 TaxID=3155762 RepID=UPI00342466F9
MVSTLIADRLRWRRDASERDRDALRAAFTAYLTALARARDAFSRTEPSPERVGKGHIAIVEHDVYAAQQQLALVAQQPILDMASRATLSVLDFHDVVVVGRDSDTAEYVHAWRAVREARQVLVDEMRTALRRT